MSRHLNNPTTLAGLERLLKPSPQAQAGLKEDRPAMMCETCDVVVCSIPTYHEAHEMLGWFRLMTNEHIEKKHGGVNGGVLFSFGWYKPNAVASTDDNVTVLPDTPHCPNCIDVTSVDDKAKQYITGSQCTPLRCALVRLLQRR